MREFPTGFSINAEEKTDPKTLIIKLPSSKLSVKFHRQPEINKFNIFIKEEKSSRLIAKDVPIKNCKAVLDFLFIPHKEITNLRKEIRSLLPKKFRKI